MRKKTIGQAFAFAASHCAAGDFFICLFGLQKRIDELPVRRAENQLVFMRVFEVFPYIGPILASIPIALTALGQGIGQAISALIVVVIVQQIEGNFVTPYFTASSTSIRPFSALIGVFILGSLMGLWGIVLAIPLLVILRSIFWSLRSATIMMKPS